MKTIVYDNGLTVFNSQAEALAKFNSGDSGEPKKFPWLAIIGVGILITAGYFYNANKKSKEDTNSKG